MRTTATLSVFGCRYVVFDLDGTLIDSLPSWGEAFGETLERHGITPEAAAQYYLKDVGTKHLRQQYAEMLATAGVIADADSLTEDLHTHLRAETYMRYAIKQVRPYPNVEELLAALREPTGDRRVFVSSASPDLLVEQRLRQNALMYKNYFMATCGQAVRKKGLPHFQHFADLCGVSMKEFAANAVMIGDTEHDMIVAKEAGIMAVGVCHTMSAERLLDAGGNATVPTIAHLLPPAD